MKILAISGSLRARSTNTALLDAMVLLAPPDFTMEIYRELHRIPPFNPDEETNNSEPAVQAFRDAIGNADVVLFSTPEYAHGIPGSLKNALDWIVGSGELSEKKVSLINASARAVFAQAALKEVLFAMNARFLESVECTVPLLGGFSTAQQMASDSQISRLLEASFAALRVDLTTGTGS